jgi:hypothetical protein
MVFFTDKAYTAIAVTTAAASVNSSQKTSNAHFGANIAQLYRCRRWCIALTVAAKAVADRANTKDSRACQQHFLNSEALIPASPTCFASIVGTWATTSTKPPKVCKASNMPER